MSRTNVNNLNEGALAGRYALLDLSNSGKFTNCLNSAPVRQDIEIKTDLRPVEGGTTAVDMIIVHSGSTFVVPAGNTAEYVTISEDIKWEMQGGSPDVPNEINPENYDRDYDPTFYRAVCYNTATRNLEVATYQLENGKVTSVNPGYFQYNESSNGTLAAGTFTNLVGQLCSLPIGYLDINNNWVAFPSFGFYNWTPTGGTGKTIVWADAGTEMLIPAGRSETYSLKVERTQLSKLKINVISSDDINLTELLEEDGTLENGAILIDDTGTVKLEKAYTSALTYRAFDGAIFVSDENKLYARGRAEFNGIKLMQFDYQDGKFASIKNINTCQNIDFSETLQDIKELDESMLHVTGYEDVTEQVLGDKEFQDTVIVHDIVIQDGGVPNAIDAYGMTAEDLAYFFANYGRKVGETDVYGNTIQPFGPFGPGDKLDHSNLSIQGLLTIESPETCYMSATFSPQDPALYYYANGKRFEDTNPNDEIEITTYAGIDYDGNGVCNNLIEFKKVDDNLYTRNEIVDPNEQGLVITYTYKTATEPEQLLDKINGAYYIHGTDTPYYGNVNTYESAVDARGNQLYKSGANWMRTVTLSQNGDGTWSTNTSDTVYQDSQVFITHYDRDVRSNPETYQQIFPGDPNDTTKKDITNVQQKTFDEAVALINANDPYIGQLGGLYFKTDAYALSVGSADAYKNCLNLVGATRSGDAGILFGIKKNVGFYGNENNIEIRLPNGKSVLPRVNNSYNLGANNQKFANVYATTFNGTATRAQWADIAENYLTDKLYPVGTIMALGGEAELTAIYGELTPFGVISENPALHMNSEAEGQPIALAGRVKVRVIGKVNKFDKIIVSNDIVGVGMAVSPLLKPDMLIGRALESKETEEEGLVLCAVRFSLD